MNIFICASKSAYPEVPAIRAALEKLGHTTTPPNGFDNPESEDKTKTLSPTDYQDWKANMIRRDGEIIAAHDAILVLNFAKNGQENYIGGAVFLEMFKAFDLGKLIFLYNPIPEYSMLADEITGLKPTIINQNLQLIA